MLGLLRRHGRNAGFALWDQGAFSAANFVFNVMLARWLDGEAYGTVTLVLSLNLAVLAFYSPLLLESANVIGPTRYGHTLQHYGRVLIALHVALCGGFALTCFLIGAALSDAFQRTTIWLLASSAPFVLLAWLARRLPYVLHMPANAATASTLYAALLCLGTITARALDALSPANAIAIVVIASAGAAIPLLLIGFREQPHQKRPLFVGLSTEIIREHWRYSRWLLLAALLFLPTSLVQTVFASTFLSVEAVGVLRAATNLTIPASLLMTAATTFALPLVMRDISRRDRGAAWRKARHLTVLMTGFCLLYYLVVSLFASKLDSLLYAGRYQQHIWLVSILGMMPVLGGLGVGGALLLRAVERPHFVLISAAISGPTSIIASVFLIPIYGLEGAAASALIAPLVSLGVIWRFFATERHSYITAEGRSRSASPRDRYGAMPWIEGNERPT